MTTDQPIHPPEVADDELLWRLIVHPDWLVRDEAGNPTRVSSVAFKDRTDASRAVSVFRPKLLDDQSRPAVIGTVTEVAEVLCSVARALGHAVTPDNSDGQHYAHALITPPTVEQKPWERNAKELAKQARFFVLSEGSSTSV